MASEIVVEQNVILAPFTSWQVGGPAEYFFAPRSQSQVEAALIFADQNSLPVTVLSGGTNTLISDQGVRGLVLHMHRLTGLESKEAEGFLEITCWSGTGKSDLLKLFLKHQLAPAVFLAGIPGDVGGGVAMNAGVGEKLYPREFVELVSWIEVTHCQNSKITVRRYAKDDLKWSYRHCSGWQPGVITRVGLRWPMQKDESMLSKVRTANQIRLNKQPLELPSCGSVFVNPPGEHAGKLIEDSGLKGYRHGGAQVSEKHANFIVNLESATALDLHKVISHVRQTVQVRTGLELKTEVVYLGEWPFTVPH